MQNLKWKINLKNIRNYINNNKITVVNKTNNIIL